MSPLVPRDADIIVLLAEELGAAKEKIRQLETAVQPAYNTLQAITRLSHEYDLHVPLAQYIIHGLLYHFCRNVLETVELYARDGKIPKFLIPTVYGYAIGDYSYMTDELEDMELYDEMLKEAGELYGVIANLLGPLVLDYRNQALIYKGLAFDEDIELESIRLVDIAETGRDETGE